MALTQNEATTIEGRFLAIERKLNEIQIALNNLATKAQSKALLNIRQAEVDDIRDRIEHLSLSSGTTLVSAHNEDSDAHNSLFLSKSDVSHTHDDRYFRETEFVGTTNGIDDAGKPVILNSQGQIDSSMVELAAEDHGTLSGLDDDDHTQYHTDSRGDARYYTQTALNNGQLDSIYYTEGEVDSLLSSKSDVSHIHDSRYYTETELDGGHLDNRYYTESETDTLISGISLSHSDLNDLDSDDHLQYLPVDGSRDITGDIGINGDLTVSGITTRSLDVIDSDTLLNIGKDTISNTETPTPTTVGFWQQHFAPAYNYATENAAIYCRIDHREGETDFRYWLYGEITEQSIVGGSLTKVIHRGAGDAHYVAMMGDNTNGYGYEAAMFGGWQDPPTDSIPKQENGYIATFQGAGGFQESIKNQANTICFQALVHDDGVDPTDPDDWTTNYGLFYANNALSNAFVVRRSEYASNYSMFKIMDHTINQRPVWQVFANGQIQIDAEAPTIFDQLKSPAPLILRGYYWTGFAEQANHTQLSHQTGGVGLGTFRIDIGNPGSENLALQLSQSGNAVLAGGLQIGGDSSLAWSAKSRIASSTDGFLQLTSYWGSFFSTLQFGGSTNLFPAIKVSTTDLLFKLADDSAYTNISAKSAIMYSADETGTSTLGHDNTNGYLTTSKGSFRIGSPYSSMSITNENGSSGYIIDANGAELAILDLESNSASIYCNEIYADGLIQSSGDLEAVGDLIVSGVVVTGTELETLIDGSDASSLHSHDSDYYTEIELDGGQLDNRYYTEAEIDAAFSPIASGVYNGNSHDHSGGDGAQIDHGGLAGLSDDDHTQYALVDGSRSFTDQVTITGSDNESQLVIKASPTQSNSNPLLSLKNSSGDILTSIHSDNQYNFFAGANAGVSNETGVNLMFVGASAGYYNTTGQQNTALGSAALFANKTGSYNTCIGYGAGLGVINQSCTYNTFIGRQAGYAITTGSHNVAIGNNTLNKNASGTYNTCIGNSAIGSGTGTSCSYNTVAGGKAGLVITSGSNNVLMGYQTGDNLTTGSNNILMGYDIAASAADVSYELNIGNLITGYTNTSILNLNGNVGIGKTPSSRLDIDLSTEDLEVVDAGSDGATEQDWIEVKVGGNTGYIRVYATK